ncbi:hypothetical protein TVAG_482740 [Trichomonas vaginalis G3]|uniref:Uncharacterized protein n=1 Tax=Trichomonas vaginalis (strain ATCC PRA-98 / G3) TaxID=412133 RepID=A2FRQ9_TRIV3|nr:hypothetical protein TVAGG3_0208660 [Trichomonas vaginalis G3]EAX92398.1 hypothetical protein TVAG_482740 [Trichomonas vaginalis G3]KAI5551086.1 hypothetical protein TVAGG3_0208660 [Trichomonas vaginalis G3]|eukprot:XP_001305328.1 hypothetical protein [Trichomonas vaginalis G3]
MADFIHEIYEFYSESEVHYFSFVRVDNDTIQLPSEPTFDVNKNSINYKMENRSSTDHFSIKNNDNKPHTFAYKFEVIVPKKENIVLTEDGLKNETKSISFASEMFLEINTYTKNDDYVIDMIFYLIYIENQREKTLIFITNDHAQMAYFRYINIKYDPIQYRGSKELNFSCEYEDRYWDPVIIYFNFEKPFFRFDSYNNNAGYIIPISFLETGNYTFTLVTDYNEYHPTFVLNITDPPQVKIENNILEKENYYKTTENSVKLIYDIEFPSNVLYSFNYYFDKNYDSKITEYIYGTNYNEHIERSINLPSSLISNDHKLHYFFNATGLTTETFENSFSLLYHKPIIHLLIDNDKYNPPIYIRSVNDTLSFEYEINDDDPDDDVTTTISIESTSIVQTISKTAPYHETFNIILGNHDLNEETNRILISSIDEYNTPSSPKCYFYFIYKYNRPEIEFQKVNNITQIDDFVRVQCKVRDFRGNGILTTVVNITSDVFNNSKQKECVIEDDLFKDVIIDIPITRNYEYNCTISLYVSNAHDEISSIITSVFQLSDVPTFMAIEKIKKFKHPNKLIPFIYCYNLLQNK